MKIYTAKAYAKINLALNIKGILEDGYHEIDTVILPINLHDTLEISIFPNTVKESFITCDAFDFNESKNNICQNAIQALRERCGFKEHFRIHIYKRIPVAGGLAGGSADAAALLKAINRILKLGLSLDELAEIGAKLGSDVPFCVYNQAARCYNKGEKMQFIDSKFRNYVLIVKPGSGLKTENVYKKCDEFEHKNCDIDELIEGLENDGRDKILKNMHNDLYAASNALLPEIGELIGYFKSLGFTYSQMTGSGSCIYILNDTSRPLYKVMKELTAKGYSCELTKII